MRLGPVLLRRRSTFHLEGHLMNVITLPTARKRETPSHACQGRSQPGQPDRGQGRCTAGQAERTTTSWTPGTAGAWLARPRPDPRAPRHIATASASPRLTTRSATSSVAGLGCHPNRHATRPLKLPSTSPRASTHATVDPATVGTVRGHGLHVAQARAGSWAAERVG